MNKKLYSDITASIKGLDSTAQVMVIGDDIDRITWIDNNPNSITKEQILAKQTELETAYDNLDYSRKRAKEYPSIENQLDDIYHNGIDAWKATIKTTKDKYPKG
jgi:hypothetical protein|tara:strand:+ start:502 stop:813 length:312 start_codon:yes stop_codon:yes gene_type:complete